MELRTSLKTFYDNLQLELEDKIKTITMDYEMKNAAEIKRQFALPGVSATSFSFSKLKCDAILTYNDRRMNFYKSILDGFLEDVDIKFMNEVGAASI